MASPDSLGLRLNNISKYPHLMLYLLSNSKRKVTNFVTTVPNNAEVINIYMREMTFDKNGELVFDCSGEKVTSSHYCLGWHMPFHGKGDFVDFNFSIPKLLYGTNILQAVPHKFEFDLSGTRYGRAHHFEDYKANAEVLLSRLRFFVKMFFVKFFHGNEKIEMRDLQIKRLDICWNEYFDCKEDAFKKLNLQKRVKKKHLRIQSKASKDHATSVFFNTRDYACKIYHKGTEYRSSKGEHLKHRSWNKDIEKEGFHGRRIKWDIEALTKHADNILRYEISFRDTYFSKVFWNKVFRKDNENWQKRMSLWKEIRKIDNFGQSGNKTKKELMFFHSVWMGKVNLNFSQVLINQYQHMFMLVDLKVGLSKHQREFYDFWKKQKDRTRKFVFAIPRETELICTGEHSNRYRGNGIDDGFPEEVLFSKDIVKRLLRTFSEFRKHFDIKEKTYVAKSDIALEDFNERCRLMGNLNEKLSKRGLNAAKKILKMLEPNGASLDSLVEQGLVSRTQAWRYEKLFEKVNFNFHTGSDIFISSCKGYEVYHNRIFFDGMEKYLKNSVYL